MPKFLAHFAAVAAAVAAAVVSIVSTIDRTSAAAADTPPPLRFNSLRFESLRALVESRDLRTLEDMLAALPPESRSSFTLMSDSLSKQAASPEQPRVILMGLDAKFLAAFNGHPLQAGFDRLEVIQFRDETRSFEFRDVTFRGRAGRTEFSETNPARCLGCHGGADPRPNWEPYAFWRGSFGANDDRPQGDGLAALLRFRAASAAHPRYGKLIFPAGSAVSPFTELGPANAPVRFRPNLRLTSIVTRLNALRLVRMLEQSPDFPILRDTLMIAARARRDGRRPPPELLPALADEGIDSSILPERQLEKLAVAIAAHAGTTPSDWLPLFIPAYEPQARRGLEFAGPLSAYRDGVASQLDYVEAALLRSLAAAEPAIWAPHLRFVRESEAYPGLAAGDSVWQSIERLGGAPAASAPAPAPAAAPAPAPDTLGAFVRRWIADGGVPALARARYRAQARDAAAGIRRPPPAF